MKLIYAECRCGVELMFLKYSQLIYFTYAKRKDIIYLRVDQFSFSSLFSIIYKKIWLGEGGGEAFNFVYLM